MHGNNTAEVIANNFKAVASEWGKESKMFAIVTDNANVMIDVARRLVLQHQHAHSLSLAILDVLKESELTNNLKEFKELRMKCRKIVTFFFKSSTVASSKLCQIQTKLKRPVLKLKQETYLLGGTLYFL